MILSVFSFLFDHFQVFVYFVCLKKLNANWLVCTLNASIHDRCISRFSPTVANIDTTYFVYACGHMRLSLSFRFQPASRTHAILICCSSSQFLFLFFGNKMYKIKFDKPFNTKGRRPSICAEPRFLER